MDVSEVVLAGLVIFYSVAAPFTKVEESFNLQAIHDITNLWPVPTSLPSFDHAEFPGVVPRTFIGALLVSLFALPCNTLARAFVIGSGRGAIQQFVTRAALGLINVAALVALKRAVSRTYGSTSAYYYMALQGTQFHVIYYASRTLPNIFALPLTTFATSLIIDPRGNVHYAILMMILTAVIFRAEVAVLAATTTLYHLLVTKRLELARTIRFGIRGLGLGLTLSYIIDSYFWGFRVIPELFAFYFNVVQGKSTEWGVSPVWQYGLDIPRLLLNPLTTFLLLPIALKFDRARSMSLLAPALSFVAIYSLQPHKEWRFIVYIVPQLTAVAATGAAYIHTHRQKTPIFRVLWALVNTSIIASALLGLFMLSISRLNYPGAQAILQIPDGARTYLDVQTCMTGASRFLQSGGTFFKTENQSILTNAIFWKNLDFASVSDPDVMVAVYASPRKASDGTNETLESPWVVHREIQGYAGMYPLSTVLSSWPPRVVRTETKLYVMRNTARPEVRDLKAQREAELYEEWKKAQDKHNEEEEVRYSDEAATKTWYAWVWGIAKNALLFF